MDVTGFADRRGYGQYEAKKCQQPFAPAETCDLYLRRHVQALTAFYCSNLRSETPQLHEP